MPASCLRHWKPTVSTLTERCASFCLSLEGSRKYSFACPRQSRALAICVRLGKFAGPSGNFTNLPQARRTIYPLEAIQLHTRIDLITLQNLDRTPLLRRPWSSELRRLQRRTELRCWRPQIQATDSIQQGNGCWGGFLCSFQVQKSIVVVCGFVVVGPIGLRIQT